MTDAASVELDRTLVEGIVDESSDGVIALKLAGTDYRLRLAVGEPLDALVGSKVRGRIRAQARRIDIIKAGGRYIEPVDGRPRRIQGRVIAIDEVNDAVTVLACAPIICRTNTLQQAGMFQPDQLVSFDVEPGARFEPVG